MSIKHNKLENHQEPQEQSQGSGEFNRDKKSSSAFEGSQSRANSKMRKPSQSKYTEVKSNQKQELHKSQHKNYSQMSKSPTKRILYDQDKKTVLNDKALSRRKMEQTDSQQNASAKQRSKQKLLHSDQKLSKIKIGSRQTKQPGPTNQKASLARQSLVSSQSHKTESLLRQQQLITEIANQVKLENLQSRVDLPTRKSIEEKKAQHSFPDIKESVSEVEASPSCKKQSPVYNKQSNLHPASPQFIKGKLISSSLILQEQQLAALFLQKKENDRQIIQKNEGIISVNNNQAQNRLKIEENTINLKLEEHEFQLNSNQPKQFNDQLKTLRQTVRDLRIQKIKAMAEGFDNTLQYEQTLDPSKVDRHKFNTVNTLINDLQSQGEKVSIKVQNYLGRIVKNRIKKGNELRQEINLAEKQIGWAHDPTIASRMTFKRTLNCGKIIDKFMSTQNKFKHFVSRQRTKSANKFSRILLKTDFKQPKKQASVQKTFQGTIIKNIVKPSMQNQQILFSTTLQSKFMDYKKVAAIKAAEFKSIERKVIQFTKVDVPQIPDPPKYDSSLQQIMDIIQLVLPLAQVSVTKKQLSGCSLKKYKNCIMLGLPENDRFKLVWHFTGKLFMGEWNNQTNEKAGHGLQIISKSQLYEGQFSSGKKYGKGLHIQAYSSVYEGDFIGGQKHGRGKYLNKTDDSVYEGEWNDGKMEGVGYISSEGNVFQGQFRGNVKEGFGVQQFQNGDRYIGEYRNDKFQGQGKYIWANGSSYLGHFKNSNRDGFGKWVSQEQFQEIYVGFYMNDKKHGSGKYRWKNGCIYQGNFDQDKKHGMGSLQYPDGRAVEGIWKEGVLTKVISKLSDAHSNQPLEGKKGRTRSTVKRNSKRKIGV